ncbi:LysR family transcriptional regulator [Ramlibacter sp. H39-3-26]|uniref:LysR family transcriptional regulator n=1 Tax=Curvibacter soli TaxID=3031331 RepID=UPI0023DA2B25|nr:LysR family transcriptional regulator [Ramlibacter sp. H39-3-26]MDF1485129.1 LysR family transcriptional regulator [Ramlibacter sp. H39-3-26]
MQTPRDILTPETLSMLQAVADGGSFAAAARRLGLVPSALTYRVRQVEDALDVLLFDRSSRQARLTEAGTELLREGERLLQEVDAVANRVKRVTTGWEPQFTIAADGIVSRTVLLDLAEAFLAQNPPTRLRVRDEILSGTLEALVSGQADLAIGVVFESGTAANIQSRALGEMAFAYVVAPHHPLAQAPEPLCDQTIARHRAVAVADTVQRGAGITVGLLKGQDVFTVSSLQEKLQAQLRGIGGGFLPEHMARPYLTTGRLVAKAVERPARTITVRYAWRGSVGQKPGRALLWWLNRLENRTTQIALLQGQPFESMPHAFPAEPERR